VWSGHDKEGDGTHAGTHATLATQFRTALTRIEPEGDAKNAAEAHRLVSAVL
jgi:hypothetical protein